MNILKKYNLIFKTTFFSLLVFLGSFNMVKAASWLLPDWEKVLTFIANTMLMVSSQILALSGGLFKITLEYTLNFKDLVDNTGVVNIGWEIIRDMSNMFFIFILLSVAIGTILGLSGHNAKNTIKNIILAALFINFSLFITGVIIDASNVMSIGFYNATTQEAGGQGISEIFSQSLNIESIYSEDGIKVPEGAEGEEHKNIFIIGLFGSIFILITAFVFFAASILFLIRTVFLMFLMMTSPIAFIGSILPKTQSLAKKWWTQLFSQAFFAPVYLMFIYIVAKGITSPAFQETLKTAGGDKGFTDAFTGGGAVAGTMVVIFNFLLIIALLLASLISAKSMGAAGAAGAIKMGKGAQGWAQGKAGAAVFGGTGRLGRRVVGGWAQRSADKLADSDKATTATGKLRLQALRGLGKSSFDVRNSTIGKATLGKIPGGVGVGIKGGYKETTAAIRKSEIEYAQSLKGTTTDASGNTITRTEARGDALSRRSIWSTLAGTTAGNKAASETLVNLASYKKDLKREQKELKVLNDDLVDERKQTTPNLITVSSLRTTISDKEDEIEKIKAKIKGIDNSLK